MRTRSAVIAALVPFLLAPTLAVPADWSNWRGPQRDGTSDETGLVSSWSPGGENLIWKAFATKRLDSKVAVEHVENFRAVLQEKAMTNRLVTDAISNYQVFCRVDGDPPIV